MGTLTAGQLRLDHYCEHKLPTSCRLSSIGQCCACYDNRAHSTTYSTYIDGVGFVSRGTRWQRYCWFCKEFWENRVRAAGLRPAETRVPHEPDQSAFLERWYEFHQGYRTVKYEDNTEERVAVLGEDLRDVAPGCLPRTLDELRAGRERSEIEEREHEAAQLRQATIQQQPTNSVSLEDTLDQMFQAATEEEQSTEQTGPLQIPPLRDSGTSESFTSNNLHAQSMTIAASRNDGGYQARRITAMRRALHRMRHGIERVMLELRDLGETVPNQTQVATHLSGLERTIDMVSGVPSRQQAQEAIDSVNTLVENVPASQDNGTLANMRARLNEAQQRLDETRRSREHAASELEQADEEFRASQAQLRQIQNEQRTTENYIRLFGTREEMLAQGDNWESPIGGMFDRAMERARAAEEFRREQRTLQRILEDEEHGSDEIAGRLAQLESHEPDVWGVPRSRNASPPQSANNMASSQASLVTNRLSPDGSGARSSIQGRFGSPQSDSDLRGPEVGLEQYYSLLRRQNWSQQEPVSNSANQEDAAQTGQDSDGLSVNIAANRPASLEEPSIRIVAGPPGRQLDEDPLANNDRGLDAVFVLTELANNEELRRFIPWVSTTATTTLLQNVLANCLTWADRENIESIMELSDVLWGTRLPAERNRRRRERGENVSFTANAQGVALQGMNNAHDVEIMAECFQMSSRVREQSSLIGPEQLLMLYRLQRGERRLDDRTVLTRMLQSPSALNRAKEVHEQHYSALNAEQSSRQEALDDERRNAARQGDHSRAELDAQRRAVREIALAAGRAAMAVGPQGLFERIANRDPEIRTAHQRLQENGSASIESMSNRSLRGPFYRPLNLNDFAASPSASDSDESDQEARGLDAKNSGRPEDPLTEQQMTILLDCKICYTQKASVVTVPCGHLAMCEWCSEQHSPTMVHDRTKPRRPAACPVCRKQVRQKFKIIRA